MNMIKSLWCIFQQCLRTFTILIFEATSQTGLFRHLSDYLFWVRNFGNKKAVRVMIFFQNVQNLIYISKIQQRIQKELFIFWDNSIWISIVKFSLLRAGYFSSVANVLTNSPKIWHVNMRDFLQHNFHASD